jgi:hypothetical protein
MLHDFVKQYYLNAPLRIGGWEGADFSDICSSLTSLPSSHFVGDIRRLECEMRINRAVSSWTTALWFGFLLLFLSATFWNFPTLLYRAGVGLLTFTKFKVEDDKKKERNEKTKATKDMNKRNAKSHEFLLQLVAYSSQNPSITLHEALTRFSIQNHIPERLLLD